MVESENSGSLLLDWLSAVGGARKRGIARPWKNMRTFTSLRIAIQVAHSSRRRSWGRVAFGASLALVVLVGANLLLGLVLWNEARSDRSPDSVRDFDVSHEPNVLVAAEHRGSLTVDRGDLPRILERGTLRAILPTLEEDHLPRNGSLMSARATRALAESLAELLGVRLVLVLAKERGEMLSALDKGHGDLVVTDLTIGADESGNMSYTHPLATANAWVVGPKGDESLPRKPMDLKGREVHLLRSSPYTAVLESLSAKEKLELNIVTVEEDLDTQAILLDVAEAERPLTVGDDLYLDAVRSYEDNVERLFKLSVRRELGWAVRKENPELLAAVNQFILGRFASASGGEASTGDLDTIKERGSLRVLTLNNPMSYFLHRGQQMGFDYELALLAARQLGVRLEMVVAPEPDLLIPWLLEGRGDVIAASLAVTSDRSERLAFSLPYLFFDEVLVQASDAEGKLSKRSHLRGKRVHVRRSSSYYPALVALREQVGAFEIVEAPEYLETRQLIGMVGEGRIPLTVADSHLLETEIAYRHDIEAAFPLSVNDAQKAVAFALRPANGQLKAFFDRFVKDTFGSVEYDIALQRYFKSPRARNVERASPLLSSDALSPYDVLLKRYSETYRLDWRLMAAQVYQESQFHADAQNWAGASGLFQIMPLTAREHGFGNVMQPDESIHSGVKHMSQLISRLEPRIPRKERHFFALAAYHAGWNHVRDARRLAAQNGWDSDKWFGHTEKAMRLLEQPRYYRRARSGYCRGSATADYVLQVQSRYEHYTDLYPNSEYLDKKTDYNPV